MSGLLGLNGGYVRIGSAQGIHAFINFRGQLCRGNGIEDGDIPDASEFSNIATATPPQDYDLPLAGGIGGSVRYFRTQESIVYVFGWVTGVQLENDIATLPVGFRPKYNIIATTSASSNDTSDNSVRIRFSTDGKIVAEKADNSNALTNGLSIVGSFIAGD